MGVAHRGIILSGVELIMSIKFPYTYICASCRTSSVITMEPGLVGVTEEDPLCFCLFMKYVLLSFWRRFILL